MRLADLDAEAAPVRELFVRMLSTPARVAALHALARVGAAARDAIPAIAKTPGPPGTSRAAGDRLRRLAGRPNGPGGVSRVRRAIEGRRQCPVERVELAAWLGDEPSRQVLNWPDGNQEADSPDRTAFEAWARFFDAQPIDVRVRIAHAAARDVIHIWQSDYPDCSWGTPTLHAIEDWIVTPQPGQCGPTWRR